MAVTVTDKACTFLGCTFIGATYRNRCEEHRGVATKYPNRSRKYRANMTETQRREFDRHWNLKSKFNLTAEQYDAQELDQGGICAICGTQPGLRRLAVDHDHACCPEKGRSCGECLRGLLCADCNGALGFFQDNIEIMKRAIAYLERGGVWGDN